MSDQADRIESVFAAALQKPSPEERAAYLDETCAGEPALRGRVEALLRAHDRAGSFLQDQSLPQAATLDSEAIAERPGTVLGPYKLVEQIGEGGMGSVWLAQQSEPVKRLVALKLIKAGMDSRQVIARFEAERQALALMDHPNIARVLDGSTTGTGRPYFVMDLVKGVPITRYCDEHHLTPRQRLELFILVCQAVQHAHQKGIIHRDLKPSNVLVALYDGKPVPKVIDFGVAKATGQSLTDKTLVTGFGAIVGTLEYMSPEQAEVNQLDIDTRSDVYSLGVLLYELLTGSPPFTRKESDKGGMLEMLRVIREQEPTKPSTKLSTAEGLPTLAANRGMEPAKLTRLVRGELDWIVMKALEKDRNRRYETASAFAADVQRYLHDEPVRACPPSWGYRVRKFGRRNKRVLTAALAFVLLLVASVAALAVALVEVSKGKERTQAALNAESKRRQEARQALDAQTSLVLNDLLGRQQVLTEEHKRFLRQALHSYTGFAAEVGQDEQTRAGVARAHRRVGHIRSWLGEGQEAEVAYRGALAHFEQLATDFPTVPEYRGEFAACHDDMGVLLADTRPRDAEAAYREAAALLHPLVADLNLPRHRLALAGSLNNLATLLQNTGRPNDAEAAYRESLAIFRQLADEFPTVLRYRREVASANLNLAVLFQMTRRAQQAENAYGDAVALLKKLLAEFPAEISFRQRLGTAYTNLGSFLASTGRLREAETSFREALTHQRPLAAEFPLVPAYRQEAAASYNNLGNVLYHLGRPHEAEAAYRDALAVRKQLAAEFPAVADYHHELAGTLLNLGDLLAARKELQPARALLEQALPHHQAALKVNPRHPGYRARYRNNREHLALILLNLGDHTAAASTAEQVVRAGVDPAKEIYHAACYLARCVPLAEQDDTLPAGRRNALAAMYADRAIEVLGLAIQNGFKNVELAKKDQNLDALRSREDFRVLLAEMEAKTGSR